MNARHGNIAEDLTGQTFGVLKVIRRTENRKGRTCWLCQCKCGKMKAVTARDLKAGKVKSCGCIVHERDYNRVDLTGRRFGRLIALYPTEKRDRKGSVYWHCRCDCGNETDITESSLVHGNYRSCGCLKSENQKNISKQLHMVDGTCVEMLEKRKYRRDNKSGFRGVYRTRSGKYQVTIGFKGQRYYIGCYKQYEDAVRARLEAENIIFNGFLHSYKKWEIKNQEDPEWGQLNPFFFEVTQDSDRNFIITQNSMEDQ